MKLRSAIEPSRGDFAMNRVLSGVCAAAFAGLGAAHPLGAAAQGVAGPTSPGPSSTNPLAGPGLGAAGASGSGGTVGSATLGEVIVTARRREENLQNVPIAVTAISGGELAKQNVVTLNDVGLTVPSFKIAVSPGEGSAILIQVRGQVETDTISTLDPSVGVYVDGIYWSRSVGADAALADVSSLQVLKGPQGTLFGRNTTGGALVVNTNDPNLSHVSGLATLTGGAYSELDAGAVLNVPIIDDKLAVRALYYHNSHDGYDYDQTTSHRLYSQDDTNIRLKILAQPTPQARLLVSYENFNINDTEAPLVPTYIKPGGNAALFSNILSGNGFSGSPNVLNQYVNGKPHTAYSNSDERESVHTQTLGATGSYDLGFGTLKLIGGYRKENSLSDGDVDGTPFTFIGEQSLSQIEEITGEAQLSGKTLGGRLDYTVGYFWFKEAGNDDSIVDAFLPLNPSNPQYILGHISDRSQAGYVQATYRFTDALSFTGGVRYSSDEKALISHNAVQTGAGYLCQVPNLANMITTPASCSQEFGVKSSDPDYLASLEYKFSPAILGYLKVAHGYRAGGDQLRGSTAPQSFVPFAPETALNYEAGLKSELLDRHIRINLAGYYTDYSNIQRSIDVATPTGGTATLIANAAAGKIYGGEFEAQALVYEGLRLGMSLSVTEASYDRYQDLLGNHVNEPFPFTPEVQYSLTGDYTHPAPHGTMNFHVDWGWQDKFVFPVGYTNGGVTAATFPISAASQSPYGLLGLRVAYDIRDPNLEVALFGRNVTNKTYRVGATDLVDAGVGLTAVQYGAPATYGVQVTYKFGG